MTPGGTFCTKVYRSQDYNSLIWVMQQLFEDVQAIKPNSSRSQSSEIFITCLKYTNPDKIDPKMLDPNHVFKSVHDPGNAKVDVLHKKYDKMNKRHRTGYEDVTGDVLIGSHGTVIGFVNSDEPIRVLTDMNSLKWTDECDHYKSNKYTTDEIVGYFTDFRVLGKIDFKKLLKWRTRMRDHDAMEKGDIVQEGKVSEVDDNDLKNKKSRKDGEDTEENEHEQIMQMRAMQAMEDRKLKKKVRSAAAKERVRQGLGMNANVFDTAGQEEEDLFTFSRSAKSSKIVADALEEYGHQVGSDSEEEEQRDTGDGAIFYPEDNLEEELNDDYVTYKINRKTKEPKAKGNRLREDDDELVAQKALNDRMMDDEMLKSKKGKKAALKEEELQYQELLNKGSRADTQSLTSKRKRKKAENSDSDDSSESDDSDEEEDVAHEEGRIAKERASRKKAKAAAAVADSSEESEDSDDDSELEGASEDEEDHAEKILNARKNAVKTEQWFSHPMFKQTLTDKNADEDEEENSDMDESEEEDHFKSQIRDSESESEEENDDGKKSKNSRMSKAAKEALDSMPMTDKEKRNLKRKKEKLRGERQQAKRDRKSGTEPASDVMGFEVVRATGGDESDDPEAEMIRRNPEIQAGIGRTQKDEDGFEIVPADSVFGKKDKRSYDSDDEEYDAHDRAQHLALGTLMLRKSRKKALVDASYNRFAWNDAKDLPTWFMDDENKHNKPQIPIPPALLEQIKSKFAMTGTKSIKKVQEAKDRKRRRAMTKLKAAKKSATALAGNEEMSEKQKLRAISKAMKNSKVDKPSKVYVVGQKGTGGGAQKLGTGTGKLKFVDKRLKADRRGERQAKKQKAKGRKK